MPYMSFGRGPLRVGFRVPMWLAVPGAIAAGAAYFWAR